MGRDSAKEFDGFATVSVAEARTILCAIAAFWACWSVMGWSSRTGVESYSLAVIPAFIAFGVVAWTCARVGGRATGDDPMWLMFSERSFSRQVASHRGLRRLVRCAAWPEFILWLMYAVLGAGILIFVSLFVFPPAGG